MLKKLILTLALTVTALVFFQPAFAQITDVEMQVDGMTCPFCVYGIEKKLEALEEVEDAGANLKTGTVDINLKENEPIDLARLEEAVLESGFTPGRINVKATGELTGYELEGKEYPALKVTGSNQVLLLTTTPDHEKEEFLAGKRLDELKEAAGKGKKITITGYVHTHQKGLPPALSVEKVIVR